MSRWPEYPEGIDVTKPNRDPDWDSYFLAVANVIALRGDCVRRKIGAIVVWGSRIWATGYNGTAAGEPGCLDGKCPRGQKSIEEVPHYSDYSNCIATHAEINALQQFNQVRINAEHWVRVRRMLVEQRRPTIYVSATPCSMCAEFIIKEGINVVARNEQGGIVRTSI